MVILKHKIGIFWCYIRGILIAKMETLGGILTLIKLWGAFLKKLINVGGHFENHHAQQQNRLII